MTSNNLRSQNDQFSIQGTYLNAAYTHPMSIASANAIRDFIDMRQVNGKSTYDMIDDRQHARTLFAKLINATPEEIAWIPSTMVGENIIVSGLNIPGSNANVVTDMYHFDGSLYLYQQLAKQGVKLNIISPHENRIDLNQLDKAIKPGTRLVALSLVSAVNGFQHDLKAVCDLAHARGALVYADIIQAAGAVPIDVRQTGVDFCACATYKWLMGDFGVGFLYVRKDRLEQLKRSQYGYRQLLSHQSHVFPYDTPATVPFESANRTDTAGLFEVGTLGYEAVAALRPSLQFLLDTGIDKIQEKRQPLIDKLQHELRAKGFQPMTPLASKSSIVTFAYQNAAQRLKEKLEKAHVSISLYDNRFRISPSVYNNMADVEKLIDVLTQT